MQGAFSTPDQRPAEGNGSAAPAPPPPSLAQAFGRSPEDNGVILQRPPGDGDTGAKRDPALWSAPTDPWRDPAAGAMLGGPAVTADKDSVESGDDDRPRGAMLSLSEVIFGKRVRSTALASLAVIALLVGAVGGLTGYVIAQQGDQLTGEVTLAEAQAAKERAAGSIADVAQRVAPAVVSIEVVSGDTGGNGSGVVIDREGYIVTNHHVVSLAMSDMKAKLTAVFTDGTRAEAKVVGTDPKTDLAVIKVNVTNPTVIEIGKSSDLAVGDAVIAIGSPWGLQNTVTEGIVSALNRPVTAPGEGGDPPVAYDAIQTDAAINQGNSGGALVDSTGALVGINSSIWAIKDAQGRAGNIGLGFAISIDPAKRIFETLIRNGKVTHASLGVNASSVAANTAQGAQVQDVVNGGPAERAGIKEGDVITRVGERMVRDAAELTVAIRRHAVGETIAIKLVRQGRPLVVNVKLGGD